ncbi:hypothetical protein SAMN05216345_105259 [Cupriavidus sp. YR651]|uniref:trypco2 family protein n=1 Tax=Cupriavidus sp. YR651 TaxID=1855315 RepID=UPI00088FAC78|nr:trypco2 family protein [Cupriavidus sp. YR651]SDD02412.1 hypothetical protein SAMN05216345_105259 [Cupriavidus sp. YR651]
MATVRNLSLLATAGLLSACCVVAPKEQPVATLPLDKVLEQISAQITKARAEECKKQERLGVYLHDIELTLGLTVDKTTDGSVAVTFPVIGQLAPSGKFESSTKTTEANTLVIKFASIAPPKSPDPCVKGGGALLVQ